MDAAAALLDRLTRELGHDAVWTQRGDVERFVEDFRGRYKADALCVVLPSSTAQVSAVLRACADANAPVLPQGGNTSLCGGAVPASDGPRPVIVSLSRMRRIRQVDAANGSIEVEAGCVLQAVQEAAAQVQRLYPISLGAEGTCQIGGTLSTNAGGTGVLRYGNTRENVLGLEVVLADGSVWNGLRALRKDNTGLDLKQLFIGAEGALGIITAATLKLHPLPTRHALAWFAPTDPAAALRVLGLFQEHCGPSLCAYELMNARQLELVLEHVPNRRDPLRERHDWHVLVELADCGGNADLDEELLRVLELASAQGLLEDAVVASSDAQRAALWEVRHSVTEANKRAGVGLTTDCAVPVCEVPAFIERATRAVRTAQSGLDVVIVGHMGDGNVHFIPMFGFEAWRALRDGEATAAELRRAVNDVAHDLGGTFSAEHGVGQTGLPEMARYKSPIELELMRRVKHALDPAHRMNPGRLVP